jgi:muconate cycloisomerase
VAKAGGLSRARTLAALAEACGLPCDVNGSLESGIGTAASLQLATAMPAISLPAVIPVSAPEGSGAARPRAATTPTISSSEPLVFEDGALRAPDAPGLGVELDEDKLDRYRIDRP